MIENAKHEIRIKRGIAAEQLVEVEELVDRCNRYENLQQIVYLRCVEALKEHEIPQWLCFIEGQLVGFCSLFGWPEPEVTAMIHPEHRRKGIGRALVGGVVNECKSRGAESCLLVRDEASASGIAFIDAMGARYRFSECRMELETEHLPTSPRLANPLDLRPVSAEEIETYARTRAAAFGRPLELIEEQLRREFSEPHLRYYLAWRDDVPIGTIRLFDSETCVDLTSFGVRPEHRRRGYGRWILETMALSLVAEGRNVFIEVETENRDALSLYRACGFRERVSYGYYQL